MLTQNYRVYLATEGSIPPRRMQVRVVFALCYPVTSSKTSYNVSGLLNVSPRLFFFNNILKTYIQDKSGKLTAPFSGRSLYISNTEMNCVP